jgi:hypothetical protein
MHKCNAVVELMTAGQGHIENDEDDDEDYQGLQRYVHNMSPEQEIRN